MFYLPVLCTVIALLSIISNLFVCVLFLCNKVWLKKPYNVFILSLAITDMMTGILMFITPGMIFKEPVKVPDNSFLGVLYCKGLWSRWPLFGLGAVSVYTCLALTVERWTAICRPFKYRTNFASKQLIGYIILGWTGGLMVSSMAAIETTYHSASSNFTRPWCKMTPLVKSDLIGVVSTISVGLKFFIPSLIILGLYGVAIVKLRESKQFQTHNRRDEAVRNVTKMAAVASLTLIICWMPNQIYFVLLKFRQVEYFTPFHNITILIVFLSSTLNPFIYALWRKHFRPSIKTVLSCCTRDVPQNLSTRLGLEENYHVNGNVKYYSNMAPGTKEETSM